MEASALSQSLELSQRSSSGRIAEQGQLMRVVD